MECVSFLREMLEFYLKNRGYNPEDIEYKRVIRIRDILEESSANNRTRRRIFRHLRDLIYSLPKKQIDFRPYLPINPSAYDVKFIDTLNYNFRNLEKAITELKEAQKST